MLDALSVAKYFYLGPDAIGDHKTKILNARATGIGTLSPEGTSDLDYVLRAARVSYVLVGNAFTQVNVSYFDLNDTVRPTL